MDVEIGLWKWSSMSQEGKRKMGMVSLMEMGWRIGGETEEERSGELEKQKARKGQLEVETGEKIYDIVAPLGYLLCAVIS